MGFTGLGEEEAHALPGREETHALPGGEEAHSPHCDGRRSPQYQMDT